MTAAAFLMDYFRAGMRRFCTNNHKHKARPGINVLNQGGIEVSLVFVGEKNARAETRACDAREHKNAFSVRMVSLTPDTARLSVRLSGSYLSLVLFIPDGDACIRSGESTTALPHISIEASGHE